MSGTATARYGAVLLFLFIVATSARYPAPRPIVPVPTLAPVSADAPYKLLCDQLSSPALGVDSASPVLRWALPASVAEQASAQVIVLAAASNSVVWNVTLAGPAQVAAYNGAPLLTATRYVWTVAVTAAGGGALTPASAPATFVTGLHGATAAGAVPLWAPAVGGGANQSAQFVFLRQQVALAQPASALVSAYAFVTAAPQAYFGPVESDNAKLTAAYKIWVNGALSGMGPGKPSRCGPLCPVQKSVGICTCAPEHIYDVRDVSGAARVGGDGASMTLALAGFNYPPSTAKAVPTDSRMFLQVELEFTDGARQTLATGLGDWRAYDATAYMGPRGSFGDASWYQAPQENFDARLEPVGWREPGYNAATWAAAAPVAAFTAPLVARPGLALTLIDDPAVVAPPLAVETYADHVFIDFGTDFSGGVCLDARTGVAGVLLSLRVGEEATVNALGERTVLPMRTSNVDAQNWTLRDGTQTLCMHEWTQFRYASATVIAAGGGGGGAEQSPPSPDALGVTLRAWVATYPASYVPLAAFEAASSGDGNSTAGALLDVYGLSWWTRVAQGFDMYFDHVRQRDVYCVEELTIDFLLQYSLSSELSLQPFTLAYVLNNRPAGFGWAEWPALSVLEVYSIFLHTGDLSLALANYERLRNFTLAGLVDARTGLWTCPPGSTTLDCNHPEVDWPPTARDGFVFTPTNTVVNAIAHAAMARFAELAAATGHASDAADFTARAAALRAAANVALRVPGGGYYDGVNTTHQAWHSTVFALAMGLTQPSDALAVASALLARTPARGGNATSCFPSSVWPTQWALEGLYTAAADDHGRAALELLVCARANGWLGMLEQNATQAPEAWSPAVKGNLEWGMTWGAAPGDLIPRFVLGVRPLSPGFASVLLQPQLGALTAVAGVVPTLRGDIFVRFSQSLGADGLATSARLEASLPGGMPATACMPLTACAGGNVDVDGTTIAARVDGDYACVDVSPSPISPRVFECAPPLA